MLIVFSGLPGSGKTTVAREVAARLAAVYLRIDVIEQALVAANLLAGDVGPAGYEVAYALARSNLAQGLAVVADGVNPLPVTREAWRAVAAVTSSRVLEVEIVCSDAVEHRRRVEQREADIQGHRLPDWAAVSGHDYEPWTTPRLVIDTAATSVADAARQVVAAARA
ncbi:AAA family ATPase [Variovorax boronicumulans]|uniref:AAA family ATPase n=1 Tax=Variovorax boronicumulans TaxID=436515 RepID=UPI0033931CE6